MGLELRVMDRAEKSESSESDGQTCLKLYAFQTRKSMNYDCMKQKHDVFIAPHSLIKRFAWVRA